MLGIIALMGIFTLMFILSGIKVVKEWERIAILRLGRFFKVAGPGAIWMTPILDRGIPVSLKIQQTEVDTGESV